MAVGLISNPQLTYGAYNRALMLNGAFKFQPLVSQSSANLFFIGIGTVSGGSDTAGYDLTAPTAFGAGTIVEFTAATAMGYVRYPVGAATQAGTASTLTLNRQSTALNGLFTTYASPENPFTAVFTNTNNAGGDNWDLANTYVFLVNAATGGNVLCYSRIGQTGDVLTPQSSLNFQFPAESATSAILLFN